MTAKRAKKRAYKTRIASEFKTLSLLDITLSSRDADQSQNRIDRALNKMGREGWRISGVVFGNRVIFERTILVE